MARALSAAFFGLALLTMAGWACSLGSIFLKFVVRLLFRPVTVSIGRAAQKNQRMHDFDRSNHDVVTTQE
jgi:hypothetical protein